VAVVVRWLMLALAVCVALVAGCGGGDDDAGPAQKSDLEGNWGGRLNQNGLPSFEIAVRFHAGSDTRVAYAGIECGGTWTGEGELLSNPPIYLFNEEIDSGAGGECKGSGHVSLDPDKPCRGSKAEDCRYYTNLEYRFDGGGVTSKGILTRIPEERLNAVFDEAGVTPP
jgi:hypothetical protein